MSEKEKLKITAILLAGGQSKRMGKDKAFLKLGEKTFFRIIIEKLNVYTDQIIVSANKDKEIYLSQLENTDINPVFVKDKDPYAGPLNAIVSCMPYIKNQLVFIATCDTPLLEPELIPFFVKKIDGYDAIIPVVNGKKQFLNTIYKRAALKIADKVYEEGKNSLYAWVNRLNVQEVAQEELKQVDDSLLSYWSINRPEDYERLLNIWQKDYY